MRLAEAPTQQNVFVTHLLSEVSILKQNSPKTRFYFPGYFDEHKK